MSSIDLDGPEPLYVQVAGVIRARIAEGTYQIDRRIPGESALAEEFGVARPTVWKAIRVLKDEGLIRGVVGRGTFVVKVPPAEPPKDDPAAE